MKAGVPDCWLHIGAPKTGSTALERFLSGHQARLAEQGLCYPASVMRACGHHDLAFLLGGGYPGWATPQDRGLDELLAALKVEIAAAGRPVILSSENFYLLSDPQMVARALDGIGLAPARTRVLVYLRRQDEAHLSWYNQAVKAQGYAGELEDCIAECRDLWDYDARLEAWAAVFGEGNIFVRPFDDLPGGDVRRDFLAVLGLPEAGFDLNGAPVNTALNPDLLAYQRAVNRLPLSPQEKRRHHKPLMALSRAAAGSGLFVEGPLMDGAARRDLLARYQSGNRAVARRWLGRDELFKHIASDMPQAAAHPELTPEKLAAIQGWLLARPDSRPEPPP